MQYPNPPYKPRTGLSSGAPHAQQPSIEMHQKPVDLFDPNFLNQGPQLFGGPASAQLSKDLNVVESIFGAQNNAVNISAPSQPSADTSHMSERDRRIFMRDQERKNRMQGGVQATATYGVAEPPPVVTTQAKLFGDQPPVASNSRDQMWQQKMAQRQAPIGSSNLQPPLPPSPYRNNQPLPSQGQGFTPATQLNQHLGIGGGMGPPNQGLMQQPSPNTAHRKFKAIGQSPLRQNNLLTSAAAQQSPMRSSLTAQKLQHAKDLDTSIQYHEQQQHNPYSQRNSMPIGASGLPPTGASPQVRGKAQGLLDQLGNNELDMRRKQDTRAQQQNEYNKYLATQAQQPSHARQRSASGRQFPDTSSSLLSGGMEMIGGHQMRQQEDKLKQQRDYQNQLNDQMQYKQHEVNAKIQLSEARKKQLSDQVFNELMKQEPEQMRNHLAGNVHQMASHDMPQYSQVPPMPAINQPMNQPNRPGLPPRVQSAVGANRSQEVQKLQRQALADDPFHKNRQQEEDAKRLQADKKREYAAMLQEQMAMKKAQKDQSLPAPDQLFDQQQQYQQPQPGFVGGSQYPPQQQVDFSRPPPMMGQPQAMGGPPGYQQFEPQRPMYAMDQQVNFEPHPSMGQPPQPGYAPMPQQQPYQAPGSNPYQANNANRSRSPNQGRHPNEQTDFSASGKLQQQQIQRSKQEEYKMQLQQQMKMNEEKKRKNKEDQEQYERANDKDFTQYMQGKSSQQPPAPTQQQATGAFPSSSSYEQYNNQGQPPPPSQVVSQGPGIIGNSSSQQPSGIRIGSDITKQREELDPAKLSAKLRYQEEIKQQMEEAKARKEAAKRKEKEQDEELERRVQNEQQKLTQQEVNEIKKEGKRDAPEIKQQRKVNIDAFQPSNDNKGIVGDIARQANNFMEPQPTSGRHADPPTVSKADNFMRPDPIEAQPLQLNQQDNFTLQNPSSAQNDLFGAQQPSSMLPPENHFAPPSGFAGMGGPPPPGGLQSPFNGGPQNQSQYSQFPGMMPPMPQFQPPPSAPMSNMQMATQSDWSNQQQSQASKMFEDQQKMIGMYQQALEQILQYRNQYFEQAMSMRENILKEREQLFEYEKMKQVQVKEMSQLKAVQNQLGNMMNVADQGQVLNSQVANNLNSYIAKQKDQIMQMSQSQSSMSKLMREARAQQQQTAQTPTVDQSMQDRPLPGSSQRVDIPRTSLQEMPQSNPQQINFSPPNDEHDLDLQKQVDDLAAQIAANDIDQQNRQLTSDQRQRLSGFNPLPSQTNMIEQPSLEVQSSVNYGEFQRNPQFEQSLSSESKMVKVPNANLLSMAAKAGQAAQIQEPVEPIVKQPGDVLTETWNEESAKKALVNQGILSPNRSVKKTPTPLQLSDNQRLVTPKRIGGNLLVNPRSPINNSSVIPQTIQELPGEEEKPQNNVDGMRASQFEFQKQAADKKSEYDFNNRMLSESSSPPRHAMVSIEAREEMDKIERIVQQQTQSAWVDRRATMTGTSFYDNHRKTQKLQEQTQQEEMQKQLMRILGSTSNSQQAEKDDDVLKAMQQDFGPDTERENNAKAEQHSSTVKIRASQDMFKEKYVAPEQKDNIEQQDNFQNPLLAQTNFQLNDPSNNQTESEINIAATDQSGNIRRMQTVEDSVRQSNQVDDTRRTFQPSDLNQSKLTEQPSERAQWDRGQPIEQQPAEENSLWDDPDMVPVPVMPVFSDNSMTYDVNDNQHNDGSRHEIRQGMPPSANGNQPYYGGHSIAQTDHTIAGLQMMVPELIATDEFVIEQIQDETGEKVLLSSKGSNRRHQESEYDQQFPKQRFQTYKQSEPMFQDDRASYVEPSIPAPTIQDAKSQIQSQIDVSQQPEEAAAGLPSARDRKEQTAFEIAEIMRIVQKTTSETQKKEEELAEKKKVMGDTHQKFKQAMIGTPVAPTTSKLNLVANDEASKMQTAAANVAPHRLGTMQRAAEEMQKPEPVVSNDQQILSDLDKIIANLELQQKNMATFGVPAPCDEDPDEDKETENNGNQGEEQDGQKTGRSQWTSLSKAREERVANNTAVEPDNSRPTSSKAPLNPRSTRPKSSKSIKSRGTSATKGGRSGIDASPQRIGKYAMMALQQKAGAGAASNASPSPQRLGKFAQLALQQNQVQSIKGEDVDNISQKYGRNPSRDRVEERSMLSQANESRYNIANQASQNEQQQPGGPILRPVSGKSNNSRYTAATKVAGARPPSHTIKTIQHDDQASQQAFRQTTRTAGQMTSKTAMAGATDQSEQRRNSKLAYYSDEDDDVTAANQGTAQRGALKPQFSESGLTMMTAQDQKYRFNIADDQDDVNL